MKRQIILMVVLFIFLVALFTVLGSANIFEGGGDRKMSFIDAAIPGIGGLLLLIWPQSMFLGSRVTPDAKKIQLLRRFGALLLLIAAGFLVIQLASA